jgi:threonine/homoserine/homoserine lactone efflux protein
MVSHDSLIGLALIHFLAVASPGPDFILVTRNSLKSSFQAGLSTALGIMVGNGILIVASASLAAYVSNQNQILFNLFRIAGGLYLGWIGWSCIRPILRGSISLNQTPEAEAASVKPIGFRAWRMGLTTSLLNAKAALYFVSVVSQFIRSDQTRLHNVLAVMLMMAITGTWFSFVAWLAGHERFRTTLTQHQSRIDAFMGLVLIGFAALILKQAFFFLR